MFCQSISMRAFDITQLCIVDNNHPLIQYKQEGIIDDGDIATYIRIDKDQQIAESFEN